jgi:hypothetical protein
LFTNRPPEAAMIDCQSVPSGASAAGSTVEFTEIEANAVPSFSWPSGETM